MIFLVLSCHVYIYYIRCSATTPECPPANAHYTSDFYYKITRYIYLYVLRNNVEQANKEKVITRLEFLYKYVLSSNMLA